MRVLPQGLGKSQPSFLLLLLLVIAIAARVSAIPAEDTSTDTDAAKTTDDPSTQSTSSVSETTATTTSSSTSTSTSSTTTKTTSSSTSTTMDTTTTTSSSSSSTSTTSDSSTSTSSVSTTTTSSTSSSSTTAAAIVTIPPTANAPYMQESNAPEGTVFIAVGAALGLIGLTLLAWRAMVAWSVNRSVRRAAMLHASENKRLLRGSRKKRSTPYSATPATDVSLDKLGAATRASYKPRVPSAKSGLFFSPTAGGPTGSHASLNATGSTGNRGSTYLPAGYYAAAGSSNPPPGEVPYSPTAGLSSPSLPHAGVYHDSHQRQSYVGASTSSLNLNQAPQGRAPSAYLEDLFENHAPSHNSDSGRR